MRNSLEQPSQKPKWVWISGSTLSIIEEHCVTHFHGDLAAYRCLNHVRNARIWEIHLKYWEDEATLLEDTGHQHDMMQMYKILQQSLSGPQIGNLIRSRMQVAKFSFQMKNVSCTGQNIWNVCSTILLNQSMWQRLTIKMCSTVKWADQNFFCHLQWWLLKKESIWNPSGVAML